MIVICIAATGDPAEAIYNRDWFPKDIPSDCFKIRIDETKANKKICEQIVTFMGKVNSSGQTKYYFTADGRMFKREGWEEMSPYG